MIKLKQTIYSLLIITLFYSNNAISQTPEYELWDMGKYTAFYRDNNCNLTTSSWQADTLNYCYIDWSCKEVSNGLASSVITDTEVDDYGNIWIAAGNGLQKLDTLGHWQYFDLRNSPLTRNQINSVEIDSNNNVWLTQHDALIKYDGTNWTIYNQSNSILPSWNMFDLIIDHNNNIWLADGTSAYKFDGINFEQFSGLIANPINPLAVAPDNSIWFSSNNGLLRYNGSTWTLMNTGNSNIPSNSISELEFDGFGKMWGANGAMGLAKYNGSSWTVYTSSNSSLPNNQISDIEKDPNGNIYVATQAGLVQTNGSFWNIYTTTNTDLKSNLIYSINVVNNNVWVSYRAGLTNFINPSSMTNYFSENSTPTEIVNDVAISKEDKWIATTDGVARISKNNGVNIYNSFNSNLPLHNIELIAADTTGNVWCWASSYGVYHFDGTNWNLLSGIPSNVYFFDIEADNNGNLWLAHGYLGLMKYDGISFQEFNSSNSGIASNGIKKILLSKTGNIFLATSNGLSIYDGNTSWINFNTSNSNIHSNILYSLDEDSDGNIWIGSDFNGVIEYNGSTFYTHYNNGDWWTEFNTSESLIVDKEDNIWMGTILDQGGGSFIKIGAMKFNRANTWEQLVEVNNPIFGRTIPGMSKDENGNIFLATDRGLLQYNGHQDNLGIISGYVYNDENTNTIKDTLEHGIFGEMIKLLPSNNMTMTGASGKYQFKAPYDNYIIQKMATDLDYWSLSTDSNLTTSINLFKPDTINNNFGMHTSTDSSQIIADFIIDGSHCDHYVPAWLVYRNIGTTVNNGKITLTLPDSINFITSTPYPDSIYTNSNKYEWLFSNLYPSEYQQINLTVDLPSVSMMGDTLSSFFQVLGIQNDSIIVSNFSDSVQTAITCAYDPNDKNVNPIGYGSEHFTQLGKELEYTIRFQNTGNDTAYFITIMDTLDFNLDMNTFKFLGSSHNIGIDIMYPGIISFQFNNINLPDSSSDFIASQGFVKFSIRPQQSVTHNTEIRNTAHIFFENNPAIVTNTTLNTMVDSIPNTVSVNKIVLTTNVSIHPNPSHNYTIFKLNTTPVQLMLFNSMGKLVFDKLINENNFRLNLDGFDKGIYFYSLLSEDKPINGKLIIN